jgi:hypothetical protein
MVLVLVAALRWKESTTQEIESEIPVLASSTTVVLLSASSSSHHHKAERVKDQSSKFVGKYNRKDVDGNLPELYPGTIILLILTVKCISLRYLEIWISNLSAWPSLI